METVNPYLDYCIAVQALRRDCERLRTPLAPATGIAASVYTHQVANTQRVLSDVRVRHLLADEVGLGKTVQALMILNTLRSYRPGLRALVVVPDHLVRQWTDEIFTRAHVAPTGDDSQRPEEHYIRLAWEAQLRGTADTARWSLSDIDPQKYDILVVDELHGLTASVQDRIVRMAPAFQHLLILTATPAFQDARRHAQLFAILEPERTAIARWQAVESDAGAQAELSVGNDLSKWPPWTFESIVAALLDRDRLAYESCGEDSSEREVAALAHCAYRRVIRTRRADFVGVVPRRRHLPITTTPLGSEVDRQALMWQYFQHLDQLSSDIELVTLAKRAILSPPSLEQRVDFFRRSGFERAGLLERVKPLLHRSQGDSRLDALVDLLAEIWRRDPHERILVAAQDNLTVDYLFEKVQARLPVVGPLKQRIPLVASRVRKGMMTETVEDLGHFDNENDVNLEAFQRGDARVLFATEIAQVGLNLQCARILVLYSVPWRTEEVEQWIGRLDRIGNAAVYASDGGARTVDVYTIAQRGLVDERVVAVLARFKVFERSVNLDGDHLDEVAESIEQAALRWHTARWEELERTTESMAAEDEIQELISPLRPWLPWSVAWAKSLFRQFCGTPPLPPIIVDLKEHSRTGPKSWDRALDGLIALLRIAGQYHIRTNRSEDGYRFRTMWYKFTGRGLYGSRDLASRVVFSFGADPSHNASPTGAHAFINRRGDIGTPPRRSVHMSLGSERVRRPLHFLNFGNPLHDELIGGWLDATVGPLAIEVSLARDHPITQSPGPGLYLVRLVVLDGGALVDQDTQDSARSRIARAAYLSAPERLPTILAPVMDRLRCAIEADVRWLRSLMPAEFHIDGLFYDKTEGNWRTVNDDTAHALLNPLMGDQSTAAGSRGWEPSTAVVELASAGVERMRSRRANGQDGGWAHRMPEFTNSLACRRKTLAEEARDAEQLAFLEMKHSERRLELARQRGVPAQISLAGSRYAASTDVLTATRSLWEERFAWLDACSSGIGKLSAVERGIALMRVR